MMNKVDYIIVGDGYAAMFFAHRLIVNNKSFVLFSEGKKSASQISAGIINPVVLKKFTTFWLAHEQIDYLKKTLTEIEIYTGKNYLIEENIHRIFHDENEKKLWQERSETPDLLPFLNKDFEFLPTIKNHFGTGIVNHSARLDVHNFFEDILSYLEKNNFLIREKFDYTEIKENVYKNIQYKNIVFCEGMGVKQNPFFKDIPLIPNKGHHLKVKLSTEIPNQYTLKKKHFIFPLDKETHYYGGTYDPIERKNKIDDFAKKQLVDGLSEFYPHDFKIEEINFGFRPTVKDRRPILGNHQQHPNFYVFNGLGARGILNGCYFSKDLFEHIENGKPLHPEVNLKRFRV